MPAEPAPEPARAEVTSRPGTAYASAMRWRRVAHRLPLTGVAVAGAVLGHMVAYMLAVPSPTVRVALLGATGHAYWTAAIAAAVVLGLASLAATVGRRFRSGRLAGRPEPGERLGIVAGQLAGFQIAIYLVQETLERLEAGVPAQALLDGRLLATGVAVQTAIALALAVLLTLAGRAAEAVGRALRGRARHPEPAGPPLWDLVVAWPSRLLAAGLGGRAPPRSLVGR
jgi:CDP-diglyceride synthetase